MADNPFQIASNSSAPDPTSPGAADAPVQTHVSSDHGGWEFHDLLGGNWPLAALFAAGVACLWGMSLMRGPEAASAQQIEVQSSVDEALAKLIGPAVATKDKTTASIVETFYCEARQRQIPPASLRGNPFVFKSLAPPPPPPPPEANTAPAAPDTGESDALAAAKSLRLQSVLMGARTSAALIGDNLLTEGQVIHGWTVIRILPREVHLAWKDKTYVLKMAE
jgi:hypothetical protein